MKDKLSNILNWLNYGSTCLAVVAKAFNIIVSDWPISPARNVANKKQTEPTANDQINP